MTNISPCLMHKNADIDKQKMSYLYSAFRFLVIYKEQKIYSVFSVNLDIGPHTVSVTSKIIENSLVTDICQ